VLLRTEKLFALDDSMTIETPLTLDNAPHLLPLAFKAFGKRVTAHDERGNKTASGGHGAGASFDVLHCTDTERRLYEGCKVKGFEVKAKIDEADVKTPVMVSLDVGGAPNSVELAGGGTASPGEGMAFLESNIRYEADEKEVLSVYGFSLHLTKEKRERIELKLWRVLGRREIPEVINNFTIMGTFHEGDVFASFQIHIGRLLLLTEDVAACPLRYYAAGGCHAEVWA
jgi:hypothetical protein